MKHRRVQTALIAAMLTGMLVFVAGCQASKQESTQSDTAGNSVAESMAWTPDTDCSACHATECTTRNQAHQAFACTTCHADGAALVNVHEDVAADASMPSKLKATKVDESACLGCHGDYETLATKTVASTALTDDKGKTVNPHEIKTLGSKDHQTITCVNCHSEHSGSNAAETASAFCVSCHHENVYECGTCHE